MKNDAEAKGAKMLVDAFGSPQAYNLYIFAKNFAADRPEADLRRPGNVLDGSEELPGCGCDEDDRAVAAGAAAEEMMWRRVPYNPGPYDDDWEDQPAESGFHKWVLGVVLSLLLFTYGLHRW